jgi:hypothetical protein
MKIGSKTAWFALIVYCRWCWSPSVSVAEYRKGVDSMVDVAQRRSSPTSHYSLRKIHHLYCLAGEMQYHLVSAARGEVEGCSAEQVTTNEHMTCNEHARKSLQNNILICLPTLLMAFVILDSLQLVTENSDPVIALHPHLGAASI